MAETAEQLVVSLEARVRDFERNFQKASRVANDNWRSIETRGEQGAKKLEATFAQATKGVSEHFKLMATTAAGALTAAFGAAKLKSIVDEWAQLKNRIASAGVATGEVAAKMNELTNIAVRTYQSIEAIGGAYQSVKRSQNELGASEAQVLRVTENLSKALALGGQGIEAQKAALLQTAQALASGTLQGDELRSILENAPELASIIATQMGVAVGKLKELGSEGKIASKDLFEAILNATDKLNQKWQTLTPTIGQATQLLTTEFTRWLGTLDQATGASAALASGVAGVASNMSVVAPLAATLAASLAGFYVGGPIVAGVAALGVGFAGLADKIRPVASELATLGDYARVAFDTVKSQGAAAAQWFQAQFAKAAHAVSAALNSIDAGAALSHLLSAVKTAANATIGAFVAAGHAIVAAWNATGVGIVNSIVAAMNSVIATVEAAANKVASAVNSITGAVNKGAGTSFPEIKPVELGRIEGSYRSAGEIAAKGFNDGMAALKHDYIGDIDGALGRLRDAANKQAIERQFGARSTDPGATDGDLDAALKSSPAKSKASGGKSGGSSKGASSESENEFQRKIAQLEESARAFDVERESIGKNAREAEKAKISFELLESAKKSNIPVTEELKTKVDSLSDAYANAKVSVDEARQRQEEMKAAASEVASTLSDGFKSAVLHGEKLSAVLEKLWKRLAEKIIDKAFNSIVEGIFEPKNEKGGNGGGNGFGFLSNIFSSFMSSFTKKADGGIITGPGGPRSDSVPAMLSAGEYVVRADATAKFKPLLDAINSGKLPKFAAGGMVAPPQIARPGAVNVTVAGQQAAPAPSITVHNHAAGVEVTPQITKDQVTLIVSHMIKENNVRIPSIMSEAERRSS